jgi:methyltransferase (TIGR00027 family)
VPAVGDTLVGVQSSGASEIAEPSRTAMMAAMGRAMHLIHYGRRALLADWLAWPLVGASAEAILAAYRPLMADQEVPFAAWFGARARLTEDWLAASGAAQCVILGAGLDSFAWRQSEVARVFEVDQPSTQAWKRQRVVTVGLPTPAELAWVPVDFERQRLRLALAEAGLDASNGVFVSWPGVVPYLTREAIVRTLRELPRCSLAVGYVPPEADRDEDARRLGAAIEASVREIGEPWLTLATPTEFAELLSNCGFTVIEDIGAHDIYGRYGLAALNYERMALARNDM